MYPCIYIYIPLYEYLQVHVCISIYIYIFKEGAREREIESPGTQRTVPLAASQHCSRTLRSVRTRTAMTKAWRVKNLLFQGVLLLMVEVLQDLTSPSRPRYVLY